MKTIEIKVCLTSQQVSLFDQWRSELNWVWNLGLELLIQFHQFKYYDWMKKKAEKSGIDLEGIRDCYLQFPKHSAWSLPMMPEEAKVSKWREEWRKDQPYKFVDVGGAKCQIAYEKNNQYIPITPRLLPESPRLKSSNEIGLTGYLTKWRCNDLREESGLECLSVPAVFLKGLLAKLAASWAAYTDKSRRDAHKPCFKDGTKKQVESLFACQPEVIKLSEKSIRVTSELGFIQFICSGKKRIPQDAIARSFTLKKEPSGYYVCIAIATPAEVKLSQNKKLLKKTKEEATKEAIKQEIQELETVVSTQRATNPNGNPYRQNKTAIAGIELGGTQELWTDDLNRETKSPLYLHKSLAKLAELQRKAARQRSHIDNVGRKQEDCKNLQKTYTKIARLHEKIRRQRRAFAHKECDKLLDQFKVIYLGDSDIKSTIYKLKPKPKQDSDGYEKNGRNRQAKFNRLAVDIGAGQFKQMLISKAPNRGTEIVKVSATHRLICSNCGHKNEIERSHYKREFACEKCGFRHSARFNAAINYKTRGSVGV